jgi:predicted secreted Zn-dependent protease
MRISLRRARFGDMKKIITAVVIMLLPFTPAPMAFAGQAEPDKTQKNERKNSVFPPSHTETYQYYEVCGCCEKDLQCEMMDKAIRWKDGSKYDSITKWKAKWDYDYSSDNHSCFTNSFRITMEIIFHFPKWVCEGHAPPSLTQKWEHYIGNLTVHEKGHRDKALKAAEEITTAVSEMAPASTCAELDMKVQRLCRERMKQLDEEQAEYDAVTDHGRVVGVAFP